MANYAIKFAYFRHFSVKQMSFIVLDPLVLGLDWQLVDQGIVSYKNRIGMGFFYRERRSVIFTFFQNHL